MIALGVVLGLGLVVLLMFLSIYNGLVRSRNETKNAFSQIDVQLKRRYDLIPNLVETAKAYLHHEASTLTAVIAARNAAYSANQSVSVNPTDPSAMKALTQAEGALAGSLNKLMMLTESYPDLKANQTMQQLTEELTSTENRVSFARQAFNDSVTQYNTDRERFPNVVIANLFGFQAGELFQIQNSVEREAVRVNFGN
jgi:LemA protein